MSHAVFCTAIAIADLPPLPAAGIAWAPPIRSPSERLDQLLENPGHTIPATRPRFRNATSAASAAVSSLSSAVNGVSMIGYNPHSGFPLGVFRSAPFTSSACAAATTCGIAAASPSIPAISRKVLRSVRLPAMSLFIACVSSLVLVGVRDYMQFAPRLTRPGFRLRLGRPLPQKSHPL